MQKHLMQSWEGVFCMKITLKGRDTKVTPALQEYAEKKFIKLEKMIDFDEAIVVLKTHKDKQRAEITIPLAGTLLRAEQESGDMFSSIDQAAEKLERQIDRYKAKWEKKGRGTVRTAAPVSEAAPAAEDEDRIIRSKKFSAKPMPVEEAILHMDLAAHSFFAFTNEATGDINVVYKRKDGGYGLLEPEK